VRVCVDSQGPDGRRRMLQPPTSNTHQSLPPMLGLHDLLPQELEPGDALLLVLTAHSIGYGLPPFILIHGRWVLGQCSLQSSLQNIQSQPPVHAQACTHILISEHTHIYKHAYMHTRTHNTTQTPSIHTINACKHTQPRSKHIIAQKSIRKQPVQKRTQKIESKLVPTLQSNARTFFHTKTFTYT